MTPDSPSLADRLSECDPMLRRMAAGVLRDFPRCGLDTDDLVQEAVVVVCRIGGRFDASRLVPFTGFARLWAKGAMVRCANRSSVARSRCDMPEGECEGDAGNDPERILDTAGELVKVLSRRERRFLVRHLSDGLTLTEAGSEFGISQSGASLLWLRIRERLKEQAERLGGYEAVTALLY